MFFCKIIKQSLKIYRVHPILQNVKRFSVIHDRHFEFFRDKVEYKNTVVQLNNDLHQSKVGGPEFSFLLKEHNIQTDGYFEHLSLRENVMKLTPLQVKDLLFLMANIKIDTVKYAKILKYLDEKCALSIERWPLDLAFFILDAWFIIWGPKVFKKHYYSAITSLWGRKIRKCSKYNLILMLYYIGMSKTAPPFLMGSIEERIEHNLSTISDEELAVACLSFFKTSTPMTSNVLLKYSCKAAKNFFSKNDRFNAISILKCLRLSKFYDAELWNHSKDYVSNNIGTFNFVECTNFLAVFASQNVYDEVLFNSLEAQALISLSNQDLLKEDIEQKDDTKTHPSVRSRGKDLARFLWTMASIGHSIKTDTLSLISNLIEERLNKGEYESQIHALIDSLQSLALAAFYPKSILSRVMNSATLYKVRYSERAKPKYQLFFVQKSIEIEHPELQMDYIKNLYHPIPKILEKDIKERKGFKDLINILNKISTVNFQCCYIMPHIMISGIILSIQSNEISIEGNTDNNLNMYKKYIENGIISKEIKDIFQNDRNYICIEILDPTICINNSDIPLGLMKTKIRQLRKLNFTVVTLSSKDINNLKENVSIGYGELKELLGLL